jgi:biotin carboxylase
MPAISKVSENLSLPTFINSKIAKICSNKHLLRKELMNFKEYSIPYKLVRTIRDFDNWERFPAIVKPDDSQGQRGITLAEKTSDFKKAFSRAINHSNSNTVIVEEFIDGFEISVNTYVVNGIPRLLFLTERISFAEYSGGIIKSHKYPITKYVDENKINKLISSVLKLLKIENGPVYFQIKINGKGNPKIIEITPRLDGCHLWRLIYSVRGINLFEIILNHLLTGKLKGNPFQNLNVNKKINCATLEFFTQAPGSVMNKNNHKIDKDASYLEWYYNEGEDILPINGFSEKVGYQIKLGK